MFLRDISDESVGWNLEMAICRDDLVGTHVFFSLNVFCRGEPDSSAASANEVASERCDSPPALTDCAIETMSLYLRARTAAKSISMIRSDVRLSTPLDPTAAGNRRHKPFLEFA